MKAIRGLRVRPEVLDPGEVICPPYDVISPEMHRQLLDHSSHNAVRWILGENPGGPLDEEVYRSCGEALRSALAEERLLREEKPSLYRYQIRYPDPSGAITIRRSLSRSVGRYPDSSVAITVRRSLSRTVGFGLRLSF